MVDHSDLAILALSSRVAPSEVPPLTARDFWQLTRATTLSWLWGRDGAEIAQELSIPAEHADRISLLLARSAAVALAVEQMENKGIWTVTADSDDYPRRLVERLGDAAPPVLHGVGVRESLGMAGIGIVGSRDIDPESTGVARDLAVASVVRELPVISGAARGVDQHAMNAAFEQGGKVVGILADSLERTVSRPSTRRAVAGGQICMVTPYAPGAPFTPGNAMGRNKIIYALSRCVVVVRSDEGKGGTWAGASEALRKRITTVAAWIGPGAAAGNHALVRNGAHELEAVTGLDAILEDAQSSRGAPVAPQTRAQLSLF